MAGEVVVDALPYFDHGYDEPGVREAAIALVEEETRRYRPTKNYLDYLPPPIYNSFETEMMKNEVERLQARLPMEMMNMKRYELPTPAAGKMTDISAWTECLENSQAQLEHQALRILNLDLMQEYGSSAWKMYNGVLSHMLEQAQKQLQDLRKKIQEINWQRKNEQSVAGSKLEQLESSWVGLVSKNYEIERACAEVEKEIQEIQQRQGKR
ncbi:pre-mRNA-splicing factor SPF27-like [Haliotis cracherodii]|uniref:pre-mRNA-splicing factor SPF27-like n=1 Tax=Haliotis rufescens TaxID=6454 RepID=UPI001EAFF64A|nr:pre-mRNA-splicing factor SPF27-like [Haliotis rufescens]